MEAKQARQLARAIRRVNGWLSEDALMLVAALDQVQKRNGVRGDLFEIGVHQGRSAIALARMAREGESLGLCDLFAGQSGNVSNSGLGDRASAQRNIAKYALQPPPIRIFEKNSQDLTLDEVGSAIRLFHIDGGHNGEEALSDLRLAAACLCPQGAIVVDDPFAFDWPGVIEGIIRFLQAEPAFCGLVAAFNKLVIVRRSDVEAFAPLRHTAFRAPYGLGRRLVSKEMQFMGAPLFVLSTPTRRILKHRFAAYYDRYAVFQSPYFKPFVGFASRLIRSP